MSTRGVRLFVFITFSEKVITKRAETPLSLNILLNRTIKPTSTKI